MPWTSAVLAAASMEITPSNPDTSNPADTAGVRGRNRLDVRLASRTVAPAGIARYDASSRSTPCRCACAPRSCEVTGGTAEVLRIGVNGICVEVIAAGCPSVRGRCFSSRQCGRDQVAGGLLHLGQVLRTLVGLGVDLVDVLGTGRSGGEPGALGGHLEATDRGTVAGGGGQGRGDRLTRQLGRRHLLR